MIRGLTPLNGFQHVAILTGDADRLHEFYREVFPRRLRAIAGGGHGLAGSRTFSTENSGAIRSAASNA
jgi:catechol 2,3-dioxygenase-like lactoylglutathione lyase family enzyme